MATAPSSRRIGAEDSKTRAQLLDAAEQLLLEEGYAAVTSRRVAAQAGLKPQLVHYYFRTMDDLFLEVFRRRAEENLARFERADRRRRLAARTSGGSTPTRAARPSRIEFVALANHRKAIRAEIARYAERFRAAQVEAVARRARRAAASPRTQMPPIVALLADDRPRAGAGPRGRARRDRRPRRPPSRSSSGPSRSSTALRGRSQPVSRARGPGAAARAGRCR